MGCDEEGNKGEAFAGRPSLICGRVAHLEDVR